jgi:large subunit ribosomal protein L15
MRVDELAPAPGATKRGKRVGRGIGGKGGKTAGRGTKGQRARNTFAVVSRVARCRSSSASRS